jgi:hypothetical protein
MNKIIIFKRLILLLLLLTGLDAIGQPYKKSRSIVKSFKVEKDTEILVKNKYGNIQIIAWEKDSVKFEIQIDVSAKKESKANTNFESIAIDFVASEYYIEAKTNFAGDGSFWSDVKDKTNTVFAGENKTQIDYKIYIPSSNPIELTNKYGNIFITDHYGAVNIVLSNGDIKAHAFYGKTTIDLQFGFAKIDLITHGNLNLNYHSEIQLNETDELEIESRSSRIRIDKANKLDINSNRDKYYIKEITSINAKTSYSYIEIQQLKKQLTITGKYGDLDINNLNNAVNNINFTFENTDVSINKNSDQLLVIELIYDEKTGLFFPEELQNKSTTKEDEEQKLVKTKGVLGNGESASILINGSLRSGTIRINEN